MMTNEKSSNYCENKIQMKYYHYYLQSILRKAKEVKILDKKDNEENNPDANFIIHHILLLPLLPAKSMLNGLNYVQKLVDFYFPRNDTC